MATWRWTSTTRSSPGRVWCEKERRYKPDVAHEPGDPGAGWVRRLPDDLEGPEHAAHAADVGYQRDPRHRRARRHHRAGPRRRRVPEQVPARHRDRVRHDQRRRRLPGDRQHARDVQEQAQAGRGGQGRARADRAGGRVSRNDVVQLLYIVAFALFIYGLMGLTGPLTAVRGNRIAAVGMAIAVIATLLIPGMGNWGLIILGVAIGTAVGIPAARQVKMTAMPQMVALFNGVGGGAVALIAWVEFRHTGGYQDEATYIGIFSLFAAIVGSVSFWGSNIAFGKLQELIPGRPISIGSGQQFLNLGLLVVAVACAVAIVAGSDAEILMIV